MRLVSVIALGIFAGKAFGADNDKVLKAQVAKTYATYAKAVLSNDIEGVMRILSPDVVWVEWNGKSMHVDEIRKYMAKWMGTIKPGSKMSFEIEKFKVDTPDKTEATVVLHFSTPGDKKKGGPKNEWHDTWVRSDGAWRNSIGEQIPWKPKQKN